MEVVDNEWTLVVLLSVQFNYTDATEKVFYPGTVADFSGKDPIINRKPLQSEEKDEWSGCGK